MKRVKNKLAERTEQKETVYCTECDEELTDFSLGENATKEDLLKAHFAKCCKTGKFKGDVCSKLFISNEENQEFLSEEI
ncbi:MAG: hypothetical protein KJ799_01070 [Bacteroidetes bacterium]|nr:hypothetical protein [Bacteroidota bacterium]